MVIFWGVIVALIVGIICFIAAKLATSSAIPAKFNMNTEEIGFQISDAIYQILKPPFLFTKYFSANNSTLSLPSALWSDPYIIGFIHKTAISVLNMDFSHLSTMEKDEAINSCMVNLSFGRLGQMLQRYPYDAVVNDNDKELLLSGKHDAKVAYAIFADTIDSQRYSDLSLYSDSNLEKAYSLSKHRPELLLPHFLQLTIHKYIKDNILADEFPELAEPN